MVAQSQAPVGGLDYVIVLGRINLQDPVVVISWRDGPPRYSQSRRIWPIVANWQAATVDGFAANGDGHLDLPVRGHRDYPELYDRLLDMRGKLAQKAGSDEIDWPEKDEKRGYAWLGYTKSPSNLQTLKSDPDSTREWMFERLETLRNVCQACLDQINAEVTGDRASGDDGDSE